MAYVRFLTSDSKDSGNFLASKENYTPTNIRNESYEQDEITVKTGKVAINPGAIYFTKDGKIIYDLDSNTRIIMSDRVNSAKSADSAVYAATAGAADTATEASHAEDASYADAASISTTINGIPYYTDIHGTFGNIASANGTLYSTAENGTLQWGILPIAQGGTGSSNYIVDQFLKYAEDASDNNRPYVTSVAANPSITWEAPPSEDVSKIPALRISILGETNNTQTYANVKLPEATTTLAGVITPTSQNLAGNKSLTGDFDLYGDLSVAGNVTVTGNVNATIATNGSHSLNVANHIGYYLETNYLIEGNYTSATYWQGILHNFSSNQTIGGITFADQGEYWINKNLTKITGKDIILTNKYQNETTGTYPTLQLHRLNLSQANDTNNITLTADDLNNTASAHFNASASIINLTTTSSATLSQAINLISTFGDIVLESDVLDITSEEVCFNTGTINLYGEQGANNSYTPTKIIFNNGSSDYIAITSSSNNQLIINPTSSSNANQIILSVDTTTSENTSTPVPSSFPTGITMGAASAITTDTLTVARNPSANMEVATKQYVDQSFAANDALVFKGVVSATTDLPTPDDTYSAGWTYKVSVSTPTLIAGEYCEAGDMLIAVKDRPLATDDGYNGANTVRDSDWVKVQNNIDGAVFVPTSANNPDRQVGNAYTPVYIYESQPVAMNPLQKKSFALASGDTSVTLSHEAYTADTYVVMINITSGEANINGAISWTSASGTVTLTTAAVSGAVSGYILTAKATSLD